MDKKIPEKKTNEPIYIPKPASAQQANSVLRTGPHLPVWSPAQRSRLPGIIRRNNIVTPPVSITYDVIKKGGSDQKLTVRAMVPPAVPMFAKPFTVSSQQIGRPSLVGSHLQIGRPPLVSPQQQFVKPPLVSSQQQFVRPPLAIPQQLFVRPPLVSPVQPQIGKPSQVNPQQLLGRPPLANPQFTIAPKYTTSGPSPTGVQGQVNMRTIPTRNTTGHVTYDVIKKGGSDIKAAQPIILKNTLISPAYSVGRYPLISPKQQNPKPFVLSSQLPVGRPRLISPQNQIEKPPLVSSQQQIVKPPQVSSQQQIVKPSNHYISMPPLVISQQAVLEAPKQDEGKPSLDLRNQQVINTALINIQHQQQIAIPLMENSHEQIANNPVLIPQQQITESSLEEVKSDGNVSFVSCDQQIATKSDSGPQMMFLKPYPVGSQQRIVKPTLFIPQQKIIRLPLESNKGITRVELVRPPIANSLVNAQQQIARHPLVSTQYMTTPSNTAVQGRVNLQPLVPLNTSSGIHTITSTATTASGTVSYNIMSTQPSPLYLKTAVTSTLDSLQTAHINSTLVFEDQQGTTDIESFTLLNDKENVEPTSSMDPPENTELMEMGDPIPCDDDIVDIVDECPPDSSNGGTYAGIEYDQYADLTPGFEWFNRKFNDTIALANVDLNEESQKMCDSNVGAVVRSCSDAEELIPYRLKINSLFEKHGFVGPNDDVVKLIGFAIEQHLKNIIEDMIDAASGSRGRQPKLDQRLRFLAELDQAAELREKLAICNARPRGSKMTAQERHEIQNRIKEMQKDDMEKIRLVATNDAALRALGPRKRLPTTDDKPEIEIKQVRRIIRLSRADCISCLEDNPLYGRSVFLNQLLLKGPGSHLHESFERGSYTGS